MEKNGSSKSSELENVDKKVPSPPRISEIVKRKIDLETKNETAVKTSPKRNEPAPSKNETKSNKIKIKVKNIAKNRTNKFVDLFGEAQHEPPKETEAVLRAPKAERKLRMHKWAEALAKAGDADRERIIENLSKRSAKTAQKLTKLIEKDKNSNKKQPIVSEMMDITDDKSDFVIVPNTKISSNDEEPISVPPPPLLSSVRQLDQPALIVDDLTIE